MKPSRLFVLSAFAIAASLSLSAFAVAETPPAPAKPAAADEKAKPAEAKPEKPAEEKKTEPKKEESKPAEVALHKIKPGEFELKITLDGVFEAAEQTPVSLNPEEWSDLTVVSVVDHGAVVKQGDVLVRLKTDDLEQQIADLEKARPLADLGLKLAKQELEALEKTTPLSLEAARRAKMEGEQDLAYFEDTGRPMQERDAHEDVKRLEQSLSYAKEELDQLEKMYKADELTEETEEIILQRTRNEVAYYEWMLEQTKARSERALNTLIPRQHLSERRSVENLDLAWRQAEQSLPENLRKKRLEVQAQELALKKSDETLADLKADLAALTVKAPHDGVVYYGASSRGKWITASTVDRKLVPGGKLMTAEVIMTIVKPAPLKIRTSVQENRLRHLTKGVAGLAAPGLDAEAEFKTALESVSLVPYADSTYDAVFTVPKTGPDGPAYYPGMTAKIRLDLYEAANALTAPKKAVHRDAEGHYVHLKDGSKRRIKVGKSNDEAYEILEGLKEGDEIKAP
jgi:HlyD family secretion protein